MTSPSPDWTYLYLERLGILCEDREPTVEQERMAREEADAWALENASTS